MDNGPLQKEQALRIKRAVGQNNHRRRKSRVLRATSLPFPGMDIMENSLQVTPAPSLNSSSAEIPSGVHALDETVPEDWNQFDSWSSDLDMSSIISGRNPATPELTFDQAGWGKSIQVQDNLFDGNDPTLSETFHVSQYYNAMFSPLKD